jgi:hypothetical protein
MQCEHGPFGSPSSLIVALLALASGSPAVAAQRAAQPAVPIGDADGDGDIDLDDLVKRISDSKAMGVFTKLVGRRSTAGAGPEAFDAAPKRSTAGSTSATTYWCKLTLLRDRTRGSPARCLEPGVSCGPSSPTPTSSGACR